MKFASELAPLHLSIDAEQIVARDVARVVAMQRELHVKAMHTSLCAATLRAPRQRSRLKTARSSPGLLLSQSKEMPNALPAVKCQTCNKWSLILALKP
jgi:hypothetical protein